MLFSSRRPDKLAAMVRKLGPHASAGTPAEAAAFGEVVLIATPYGELEKIGHDLGARSKARSCSTPAILSARSGALSAGDREGWRRHFHGQILPGRTARARLQRRRRDLGRGFGGRPRRQLGVPLASDDKDALRVAERLVRDAGCELVTVGDLAARAQLPTWRARFPRQHQRSGAAQAARLASGFWQLRDFART